MGCFICGRTWTPAPPRNIVAFSELCRSMQRRQFVFFYDLTGQEWHGIVTGIACEGGPAIYNVTFIQNNRVLTVAVRTY